MPWPLTAWKPVSSLMAAPFCLAPPTTAWAMGCSLPLSAEAARARASSPPRPRGSQSVSWGSPLVMVPVLSKHHLG